jgi:hypothetical protein
MLTGTPAAGVRGRAEHAERSARAAEQAEAGQHERADEQEARPRSQQLHEPPALSGRVGEDRTGVKRARVRGMRGVVRLRVHEASVGERNASNRDNRAQSVTAPHPECPAGRGAEFGRPNKLM